MKKFICGLLACFLLLVVFCISSIAIEEMKVSTFLLSSTDPTPESNPAGAYFPGIRGGDQLIKYTKKFGDYTETNEYGTEVTVINGIITDKNGSNSLIPKGGYILSGHGAAKKWLNENTIIGTHISINNDGTVSAVTDSDSYLYRADNMIQQAKNSIINAEENACNVPIKEARADLQKANTYFAQANETKTSITTEELRKLTDTAYNAAEIAYYKSLSPIKTSNNGVWIRPDTTDVNKIKEIVNNIKQAGLKDIYLETFYHGYTIYPSEIAKEFGFENQNPKFKDTDILKEWVKAAHQNDLKLHVWFETFYAGTGNSGPILSRKPEWANIQRKNIRTKELKPSSIEPNAFFMDPANPEVRYYVVNLVSEICKNYEVDGINLDYIRYPNSLPENFPSYLDSTWGYTETARKEFKLQMGIDPVKLTPDDKLWADWVQYRQRKVNLMVREVYQEIKSINKNIILSAVVFPDREKAAVQKLQNWKDWIVCRYIDRLTPIILGSSPELIATYCLQLRDLSQGQIEIIPGIFGAFNNDIPVNFIQQVMATNISGIDGINIFDYAHLKPEYVQALNEGPFKPAMQYR